MSIASSLEAGAGEDRGEVGAEWGFGAECGSGRGPVVGGAEVARLLAMALLVVDIEIIRGSDVLSDRRN